MNPNGSFQACVEFIKLRILEGQSLPTLVKAARQIMYMAIDSQDNFEADYAGGYADASEDALYAISGVWRYHPDYEGWADD